MTSMLINGSETGTVRLFHLDLPPEAIERFTTMAGTGEWPLKYGLGAKTLRPAFVDVVSIRDLEDMPLSRYMAEAHNASGADFNAARPQIDALKGHVLILPSQAFDNTTQTLTVAAPLRWVGTFSELAPKARGARLRTDSAKGIESADGPVSPPLNIPKFLILAAIGVVALVALVLVRVLG
ncbi:aspartate carbamoyltransferase catalytic subunit [Tropicibacter oceani]|uniref:Aspartate carbamoyltransferase catalytic subunit n=1 Tax=Tropicibacter oceani TaxID=3058420 RepID=A0ABY8QJK4_9RHOB|nr:aspartate carbamoyltransferase catalytic subunit [Tropicibacter oceani]WGW04811.1 aspartate carbamoyltransferase catalytic subunit [Tropicibacter oceani]